MNYNSICPVCQKSEQLNSFKWGIYNVIHCLNCRLDYCGEMDEKEKDGDSSPVHMPGITMMANMFYKTHEMAMKFAIKRKQIYEHLLDRDCNKILEVGCGPGVFYKPWSNLNVQWTGIDINSYWKDFGEKNGVPISNKPINSIKDKYDVVMAHQVIEHVEDPVAFMQSVMNLVNPGGIIHLELPNQNSATARLRKISSRFSHDYGFIQPPMHLRAYHKKTIKYLFNILHLKSRMVFVCANTDKTWGQVRDYKMMQRLFYSLTGKTGMGSLLIGIAQSKLVGEK